MEMQKRFTSLDEREQKEKIQREQENVLEYSQETDGMELKEAAPKEESRGRKLDGPDTIMNRRAQWQYTKEQKEELHKMMALGMPKEAILAVFYPETDAIKMREIRRTFRAVSNQ